MPRVLVSPADFSISNEDYGKTYNLLSHLRSDRLSVDAYVSACRTPFSSDTVTIHEFERERRLAYYLDSFRVAASELRTSGTDVYHHMNLSYRWFNPVLLAGLHGDTPVVIGPCQAGHAIMGEEFNMVVGDAIGIDLERSVTDPLYRAVEETRDVLLDPFRLKLFQATLEAADTVVVVHEEAKETYAELIDESKIEVIPLGVNPDEFEFAERTASSSLVAIGHLKRRKGYDVLIEAMDRVREAVPDVELDVFGKGPLESELREQVRRLGLEEHVTFRGYVDQSVLKEYLDDARAFVHPSRSESFSLVRLEAMANGCPVVVSNTDGTAEMVRDGTDGYIVPPESPEPLAERIVEILSDVELAREMGRNARQQVEQKYDWQLIADQYVDVYESLV